MIQEPEGPLSVDEMRLILERIAREGSDSARIQAIKVLVQLDAGGVVEDELERILRTK
jgi:hypothetical protein